MTPDIHEASEHGRRQLAPREMWVHQLHQITGLFALRGKRVTAAERAEMIATLQRVLDEMADDRNWST